MVSVRAEVLASPSNPSEVLLVDVLSADLVQRLAKWRGEGNPVISLYLNVDGREKIRPEDYQQRLDQLIRNEASSDPQVQSDLKKISEYVATEFSRGHHRGLAVFASGDELWHVVGLTVPVEDQLAVNATPHVRGLENLLDEYEPVGVILTDRQKARLFVIELGTIVARDEVVDPLPRHDDDKGDWRKDHVKAHASEFANKHLRHTATEMFELYKKKRFSHLVLFVPEDIKAELEKNLHDYLRSKVIGQYNLPVNSSDEEIIDCAYKLYQQAERATEHRFVEKLRAGVPTAGRDGSTSSSAVAGLDSTLQAIFEKRVETLLVSEGYSAEGWRCHQCNYITTLGRNCSMCGSEMTLVSDVVEEAVEDAISQKCRVEFCSDNADLDVMGQIGALLRF
jgi:peptide chain release factor subunit 1